MYVLDACLKDLVVTMRESARAHARERGSVCVGERALVRDLVVTMREIGHRLHDEI